MSEMERLQLEEAIQLSLALEASKQDDRHSAYRYYQGDDIDTDAFGVSFLHCIPACTNNFRKSCEHIFLLQV